MDEQDAQAQVGKQVDPPYAGIDAETLQDATKQQFLFSAKLLIACRRQALKEHLLFSDRQKDDPVAFSMAAGVQEAF